jgi:hypothetical protein
MKDIMLTIVIAAILIASWASMHIKVNDTLYSYILFPEDP